MLLAAILLYNVLLPVSIIIDTSLV